MRRKLRIFSNIAIIALSVCMFAFGVYAANQVSVTTSGTVTFTASGVYASVTRTVSGTKSSIADITTRFDSNSDGSTPYKMGDGEQLEFTNPSTPIVMTFTITNLATDRNIDVIPPVEPEESGNVITAIDVFEPSYADGKVNVNPSGVSGDSLTIKIYFYVKNINLSSNLDYNFTIELLDQADFANTATVTGATQTKVGNTYLFTQDLSTNNTHFEKFVLTGANCYDYMPYISGTDCIVPVHTYGTNAITYSATVENTTAYTFTVSNGTVTSVVAQ